MSKHKSRPLKNLPEWLKQTIEQPLHVLIIYAPLAMVMLHPSVVAVVLAAATIGGVREWDQRPIDSVSDLLLDCSAYAVGAGLVCFTYYLVHGGLSLI